MAVEKSGGSGASSSSTSPASSMDRFHKIALSWDYLRLVANSKGVEQVKGQRRVKNTYASVAKYFAVFEPLLFEEVKAQVIQGRSDEEEEVGLDWQKGVVASCVESKGFHKVSMAMLDDFREMVSENDLLLLSKEKFEEGVTPTAYSFALVEQWGGRETISLRTFLAGEIKNLNVAKPVSSSRLQRIASIFATAESFLWILKHYQICSLSTIMREYLAMHSVACLPFKDLILLAAEKHKDGDGQNCAWNVPEPPMDYLKTNLNDSQLDAVNAGLSRRSFVLIQGPLGAGKIQTILGLLSAVLHSAPTPSGGLAGQTPYAISATVTGLVRLTYEFSELIGVAYKLLHLTFLLMQRNNQEIVKANLGFIKALVAKSKADVLHEHLKGVVEGLFSWQSDTKNSFKAKGLGLDPPMWAQHRITMPLMATMLTMMATTAMVTLMAATTMMPTTSTATDATECPHDL